MSDCNPEIQITRFARADKRAKVQDAYGARVEKVGSNSNLEEVMEAMILQHSYHKAPRFWGFATYLAHHAKEDVSSNGAVVLEYEYRQLESLKRWAETWEYRCYLINTEPTSTRDNRVALIIPLAQPITEASSYSRLASLLARHVGLDGMTDGSQSCTFLIEPASRATVWAFGEEVLDGYAHIRAFDGLWTEANSYIGIKPVPRLFSPRATSHFQQRRSTKSAQLDAPINTGLFEGL